MSASIGRGALATATVVCAVTAASALAGGGMTLSPLVTEHRADPGSLGSVVVRNTSGSAVSVTVTPRPWSQASSGRVTADRHRSLLASIRPSVRQFRLSAGGSRSVMLKLLKVPSSGSLFGAVTVRATPVKPKKGGSGSGTVVAAYELVGSFRATPSNPRLRLQVGGLRARGSRLRLAVRNAGNTIDPVTGSYRLSGATGTISGGFAGARILPGNVVDLPVGGGLSAGRYRLTGTLIQRGGNVASFSRSVKVG